MGFWGSLGKFAGKVALGIVAPGALAGYEYQKAKQTNEMFKGYDEAIEPLFKSLSLIQEDDSWSELLVLVRSFVVKFLGNENVRAPLLKKVHPNEQARTCCLIASGICEEDSFRECAEQHGAKIDVLRGTLNIIEEFCEELDKRIAGASLTQMEENVVRMFFDILSTRNPHLIMIMYVKHDSNVKVIMEELIADILFPDEENSETQIMKDTCAENKVSYDSIKRKMRG